MPTVARMAKYYPTRSGVPLTEVALPCSVSHNRLMDCCLLAMRSRSPSINRSIVRSLTVRQSYAFHADSANGPPVNVDMGCYGNKMVFVIDSLLNYEGRMIYASLDRVYDLNGNRQYEPVNWSFEVSNNPIYWYPRVLDVTVERGTEKTMTPSSLNTGVGTEGYTLVEQYCLVDTTGIGRCGTSSRRAGITEYRCT